MGHTSDHDFLVISLRYADYLFHIGIIENNLSPPILSSLDGQRAGQNDVCPIGLVQGKKQGFTAPAYSGVS